MDSECIQLQRQKLNELVLERLFDWIMDGTLTMGQKLNAEKIAQRLGVSRMPVREAFNALEQMGLAEAIPYVGFRIVELDDKDVHELYLMRQMLEPQLAYYACANIDEEGLEEIRQIQQNIEQKFTDKTLNPKELHTLNRDFHFTVYQYAYMDRVYSVVKSIWDSLSFYKMIYNKRYISNVDAANDMIGTHRKMIEYLSKKDGEAIRQLLAKDLSRHTVDVPEAVNNMIQKAKSNEELK